MKAKTDQELLLCLAQDDNADAALDHFFKRHSNKVYNYALKRGLNGEQAQDVVQIVFLQIYRKRTQYNPKYAALAWVYVITRSELKDYKLRELKNYEEFNDFVSQAEQMTPNIEKAQEVSGLLTDLGEKERQIIEDRYLNELEYEEIARKLNESESNVRQIVSRSLRFLRKKHGAKSGEEL
ncbi:RNA polymerase sigma factor [Bdellovibrio sp. HCB337]|uniref:RNA polymerase sigma factor n=1 Tax=Bdellovibrio sp. HCB337 TaxID=3394358 RepID=UPI0039A4C6CB